MLKWLTRKKPTLDELLRGIKTEEGRKTAIVNAVQMGKTAEAKYVRTAVETLEQRELFRDAGILAEDHNMPDRAIANYRKAETPYWAGVVAYSLGRKTDAAKFFLEAKDFERAASTALESGDKKFAVTAYERIAEARPVITTPFFSGYDFLTTYSERSQLFLEAARFARGARDRRANHLYEKAITNKVYGHNHVLSRGGILGGTPGKKLKIDELVAIAREFGNEAKAVEIAARSGSNEIGGRLALALGMTREAERLLEEALGYHEEGTLGRAWTIKRLTAIHPRSVILHYEKTGQYGKAARLARKTGNKEQARHYSQLAAKFA